MHKDLISSQFVVLEHVFVQNLQLSNNNTLYYKWGFVQYNDRIDILSVCKIFSFEYVQCSNVLYWLFIIQIKRLFPKSTQMIVIFFLLESKKNEEKNKMKKERLYHFIYNQVMIFYNSEHHFIYDDGDAEDLLYTGCFT